MGEFAGYALDEVMDHEDDRLRYKLGQMSLDEAYDLGIIDEMGYQNRPWSGTVSLIKAIRKPTITCKYCGLAGFRWKQTDQGQWRLHEVDKLHECSSYVAKNGK